MVLHKSLSGALATAALAVAWTVAAPAGAAVAADTTTTFAVSGGALGISAPGSANLGTGAAAGTLTAQLGAVTATDARGALGAGWTAAAASTAFANSTTPAAASITTATYSSGLATGTTGIAVFLQGQTTTPAALSSTAVTAYSASASVGNNSATWNPTIVVSLPAQAIAGSYTGTITHSLS
jgi:hypothetical protein